MDDTNWCLSCERRIESPAYGKAYCSERCRTADSPSSSTTYSEERVIVHQIHPVPTSYHRIASWRQNVPSGPDAHPDHPPIVFRRPARMADTQKHPSGTQLNFVLPTVPRPSPPMEAPLPPFRSDDPQSSSPDSATHSSLSTPSSSVAQNAALSPKRSLLASLASSVAGYAPVYPAKSRPLTSSYQPPVKHHSLTYHESYWQTPSSTMPLPVGPATSSAANSVYQNRGRRLAR